MHYSTPEFKIEIVGITYDSYYKWFSHYLLIDDAPIKLEFKALPSRKVFGYNPFTKYPPVSLYTTYSNEYPKWLSTYESKLDTEKYVLPDKVYLMFINLLSYIEQQYEKNKLIKEKIKKLL